MTARNRRSKPSVLVPVISLTLAGLVGLALPIPAQAAAEPLDVEGLPQHPEAYKQQVDRIVKRVDTLIDKVKAERAGEPALLELVQARDNVQDEAVKVVYHPPESRWTTEEARESTDAMLRVLKAQYDKAAELAG